MRLWGTAALSVLAGLAAGRAALALDVRPAHLAAGLFDVARTPAN
jgi:hypothetical protein